MCMCISKVKICFYSSDSVGVNRGEVHTMNNNVIVAIVMTYILAPF